MEGFLMTVLQQQLRNMRESVRWASKYEPSRSFIASGEQESSRIAELVKVCRWPLGRRWRPICLQQNVTGVRM